MEKIVCAFTGHRPKSFPWKYDESAHDCILLKEVLAEQIEALADSGVTDFLSGMAQGTDLWCSEIVLDLKKKNPALNLHCILPCKGQESKWTASAQERYHAILAQANDVVYVGQEYSRDCMLKRNRYLVDHSSFLLAIYNGSFRSGTGATVRYARQMKKIICILDPLTRTITKEPVEKWNYENAVRTAVRNGHRNLSNYILYNFEDRPVELYLRLKLNVDLCEELGASIYSFPMKYHPIEDPEYFDNRDFIGKHWNRKFIRTIQAILNSTKGKVGRGHDFFCKAFGANEQEYFKLLYMPEAMIIYRFFFEGIGLTDQWWAAFSTLSDDEMAIAKPIIEKNVFTNIQNETDNNNVLNVLRYYCITRDDAEQMMANQ